MLEAYLAVSNYWKIPEDLVNEAQKPHVVTQQPYFRPHPISQLFTYTYPVLWSDRALC